MAKRDIGVEKVRKNFYITLAVVLTVLTVTYVYTRPLHIQRIVEGNILILDNGKEVRLIGVNKNGRAHTYISTLMADTGVTLNYDQQETDGQGRLLAYVYLSDGRFLNVELIRQGYASIDREIPFTHSEQFEDYQREAKQHKRGMWAE